jgi:predicted esterase YcpF (UPF0227 family)
LKFFYFNGFNSAILEDWSGSPKIVATAEYARAAGFEFLPVSINFRDAARHSREILGMISADDERVVFCGSSMGGWFARIMQLLLLGARPEIRGEAMAFNPAFSLVAHAHMLCGPQVNYVTLEEYEWTDSHSKALQQLEMSVDYDAPQPFFVYVDKGDEVIAWEHSAERHSGIANFVVYEGGCHSFDHFHEALQDFDAATRRTT